MIGLLYFFLENQTGLTCCNLDVLHGFFLLVYFCGNSKKF
jgi:hypothetical protein